MPEPFSSGLSRGQSYCGRISTGFVCLESSVTSLLPCLIVVEQIADSFTFQQVSKTASVILPQASTSPLLLRAPSFLPAFDRNQAEASQALVSAEHADQNFPLGTLQAIATKHTLYF